jgi:hypothetical protein
VSTEPWCDLSLLPTMGLLPAYLPTDLLQTFDSQSCC